MNHIQEKIILYVHKINNELKANMNVYAHVVSRKTFQGVSVLYLSRRIMILQRNTSVTNFQIDTNKKRIRNIYVNNATMI